jgi:isopenicillin N synthase-like dioxygenase
MEKFYERSESISLHILEALEIALGVPSGSFLDMMRHNASELRLNHYPAISISDMREKNISRTSPHFDLGVITLLFQDKVGGLEIQDRSGQPGSFMSVPCHGQSEMIVNIAETFQRWTNDSVLAGLHKVTIPESLKNLNDGVIEERFSIVYLCKADRDASVAALCPFVSERGSKYGDMSALEYHQQRLSLAYQ